MLKVIKGNPFLQSFNYPTLGGTCNPAEGEIEVDPSSGGRGVDWKIKAGGIAIAAAASKSELRPAEANTARAGILAKAFSRGDLLLEAEGPAKITGCAYGSPLG